MITNTLCREERLRGRKAISKLFNSGHSFFQSPYKVFWLNIDAPAGAYPSCFAVSVPKKRFKKAVVRNLLKRRTREAFRLNKNILNHAVAEGNQVHIIAIYSLDKILCSTDLGEAMKKVLHHIHTEIGALKTEL